MNQFPSLDTLPRRRSRLLWLKRISLGLVVTLLVITLLGAAYEAVARRRAAHMFPPSGRLIDIGGRKIHLDCRGSGSPTVVFEAGFDHLGSLGWGKVHDAVAATTRACAYDRAGIMWSDPKSTPQDGNAATEDLHAALAVAGERAPIVLVGHSFGGLLSMIYAHRYPDAVAGLVFVDPGHPDQKKLFGTLPKMRELMDAAGALEKTGLALSWTGLVRLLMPDMGDPAMSPAARQAAQAYYPMSLRGMHDARASDDRTMAQAAVARPFGNRPLIVLSAENFFTPEMAGAVGLSMKETARANATWRKFRDEEASWSTRGTHRMVPNTGHYIQFDQPAAVISAVREVVQTVRTDRSMPPAR